MEIRSYECISHAIVGIIKSRTLSRQSRLSFNRVGSSLMFDNALKPPHHEQTVPGR